MFDSNTNNCSSNTYSTNKYPLINLKTSSDIGPLYQVLDPDQEKFKMLDLISNNQSVPINYSNVITDINNVGTISPSGKITDTPGDIILPLKIHQKRTLYEMISRENAKYRCADNWNVNLLCDNVGSGKSLCVLALIAEKRMAKLTTNSYYSSKPCVSNNYSNNYYGYNYDLKNSLSIDSNAIELKSNLIIVPHNVFNQWKKYIITFTKLKAIFISTNKNIADFTVSIDNIKSKCDSHSIVLVKSTMYKSLYKSLQSLVQSRTKITYPDEGGINEYSSFKDNVTNLGTGIGKTVKSLITGCEPNMTNEIKEKMKLYLVKLKKKCENLLENTDWDNLGADSHIRTCTSRNTIYGIYFQRVIVDEVDSIRIPAFPYIYSKQIWYISSSINNLLYPAGKRIWNQNTHTYHVISTGIKGTGFLKDILINMFGKRNSYNWSSKLQAFRPLFSIVRNNLEFISDSIKIPEPIIEYIKCYTPAHLSAISSAIDSDALKALNAGDMEKAIELLGCEQCSEESLVEQVTKKIRQKKLVVENTLSGKKTELEGIVTEYENIKLLMKSFIDDVGDCSDPDTYALIIEQKQLIQNKKNTLKASIKQFTSQFVDLTNKIEGIESRITDIGNKNCPICYSTAEGACITPCCRNVFCLECLTMAITTSAKKDCPLCRTSIDMKDVNIIINDTSNKNIEKPEDQLPNKIDKLMEIIMSNPTKRFMVFSEFEGGIDKIKTKMDSLHINYSGIKGSTASIDKKIEAFKNKDFNVLLLNAKFFGAGLNLQFTDEIIIFHRMSKDLEKQVIGRAQRIGRTNSLKINYLCYDNEYTST